GEARRPVEARALLAVSDQPQGAAAGRVKSARHSEVHRRPRPPIELEPEMLAVTLYRPHAATEQRAAPARRGDALEDDRIVGAPDIDDAPAARDARGDAARRLDLWQLRHSARRRDAARSWCRASDETPRASCGSWCRGRRRPG